MKPPRIGGRRARLCEIGPWWLASRILASKSAIERLIVRRQAGTKRAAPIFADDSPGVPDPPAILATVRRLESRHRLREGVAVLAKSAKKLFAGMEQADSIALDPHKWLYLPVDVGCMIYRDPEIARATFAHEAEYTRMFGEKADEAFVCWDYGPELSRRFRALKVWMQLKGVGLDRLSEAIESNLACARCLESMVQASDEFEMAAPVELSIFCFRHVPEWLRYESPEAIDTFNERLLVALQRDGSSYLSNATLGGRFALRG